MALNKKREKKLRQYRVTVEYISRYDIDVMAYAQKEARIEAVNPYAIILQKQPIKRYIIVSKVKELKDEEETVPPASMA